MYNFSKEDDYFTGELYSARDIWIVCWRRLLDPKKQNYEQI